MPPTLFALVVTLSLHGKAVMVVPGLYDTQAHCQHARERTLLIRRIDEEGRLGTATGATCAPIPE